MNHPSTKSVVTHPAYKECRVHNYHSQCITANSQVTASIDLCLGTKMYFEGLQREHLGLHELICSIKFQTHLNNNQTHPTFFYTATAEALNTFVNLFRFYKYIKMSSNVFLVYNCGMLHVVSDSQAINVYSPFVLKEK